MCLYKHFTLLERESLQVLLVKRISIKDIAKELGKDKSSIYREIKRNSDNNGYKPAIAELKYNTRRQKCKPKKKLENKEMLKFCFDKLVNENWSPEQISGRLKEEKSSLQISYPTIYRGINNGLFDREYAKEYTGSFKRTLRHKGKRIHRQNIKENRGKFEISHHINERPIGCTNRTRMGHFECDTVVGKKGRACLVTLVDRKSRYLIGGISKKKDAINVNNTIIKTIKNEKVISITPDRGKEFSKHKELSKNLNDIKIYFPDPYSPWQRGTNENTNGLIRQYFPKRKDMDNITNEYVDKIFLKINLRPRKCLNYKTPYEIYHKVLLHLA